MIKNTFKIISMIPIFLFIGVGIFISLDIIQPSMFKNLEKYYLFIIVALGVGAAPIILITNAINHLMNIYVNGKKSIIYLVSSLVIIFMISEIIYSFISIQGFFADQSVPITKIVGIICLPFTFSLYYFIGLIFEKIPIKKLGSQEKYKLMQQREEIINELKAQV